MSIEPNVKEEFMFLLHEQGKIASVEIGLWVRGYLKEHAGKMHGSMELRLEREKMVY